MAEEGDAVAQAVSRWPSRDVLEAIEGGEGRPRGIGPQREVEAKGGREGADEHGRGEDAARGRAQPRSLGHGVEEAHQSPSRQDEQGHAREQQVARIPDPGDGHEGQRGSDGHEGEEDGEGPACPVREGEGESGHGQQGQGRRPVRPQPLGGEAQVGARVAREGEQEARTGQRREEDVVLEGLRVERLVSAAADHDVLLHGIDDREDGRKVEL